MTEKFLSKDPAKALEELKSSMYLRLELVRSKISYDRLDSYNEGKCVALMNERLWLEQMLDKIERS